MRCFLSVLVLLTLAKATGCQTPMDTRSEHRLYDAPFEHTAEDYRLGRYEKVDFIALASFFRERVGELTVAELENLLGEPRVVKREDPYYRHALNMFYDWDVVSDPDWDGGDEHDQVLHYSENGPPDHWMPDESFNLFFIVKNDVVVGMRTLFP